MLGAPRKNEYTGEREWSIDVTPDAEGRKLLRQLAVSDRLREPKSGDSRDESFISFRQKEFRADGAPSDPIRVVDADGQPWDDKKLIGNGTVVDVKFAVKDYGKGKKKGVYIRAIRVLELVPYVTQDFAPLSSDDEFFAARPVEQPAETGKVNLIAELDDAPFDTDDLNDDIPE